VAVARMEKLKPRAARAVYRARRRVARWAAPDLEPGIRAARGQLGATKAALEAARADLRSARADLRSARGDLHGARADLRETRAELTVAKESLRSVRAELRDVRAELREARRGLPEAALFDIPAPLEQTIDRVREEHLTFLPAAQLRVLAAAVLDAERRGLPGLIIEAGTARGGSAIVMAAAKAAERPMKVYDVFGMIPPPTEQDGADVHARYDTIVAGDARGVGGEVYYGYREDLKDEVAASFARHGVPVDEHRVDLVQGLFADTIDLDEPVAVAHLDGDWYESTMTCLVRVAPLVVPGGRIILDDYYSWSGCRTAVDEYFAAHTGFELEHGAKLHAVRR
jgi:Macrocin-O-methyltransferase (TylF)